jgi:hypothetical protein
VLAVNPKAVVERDGRKQVLRVKDDTVEAVDRSRRGGASVTNLEITGGAEVGRQGGAVAAGQAGGRGMKIAVAAK